MERPPTYYEVRNKMIAKNWEYVDRVLEQFPDRLYSSDEFVIPGTLLAVAALNKLVPAIRHLLRRGVSVNEDHGPDVIFTIPWLLLDREPCPTHHIPDLFVKEGDFDPFATYEYRSWRLDDEIIVRGTLLHYMVDHVPLFLYDDHVHLSAIVWLVNHDVPVDAHDMLGQTAFDVCENKITNIRQREPVCLSAISRLKQMQALVKPKPRPQNANT